MPNYEDCVIYTIRTGDSLYVGSTCNFTKRKYHHNHNLKNENSEHHNLKIYKTIRENDGEWDMKPYKIFPCKSKIEMNIEEERCRIELNADLNMKSCQGLDMKNFKEKRKQYVSTNKESIKEYQHDYYPQYAEKNKEKLAEYHKTWQQNNKDNINKKITCECGCISSRSNLPRHRKSKKHLKLMENIKQ